jgi:hypothetical protein
MIRQVEVQDLVPAMGDDHEQEQSLSVMVGTVKKSTDTRCPIRLLRNVFQLWDGRRGRVRRMSETVRSGTAILSIWSDDSA